MVNPQSFGPWAKIGVLMAKPGWLMMPQSHPISDDSHVKRLPVHVGLPRLPVE
jgi:hypothetical protein